MVIAFWLEVWGWVVAASRDGVCQFFETETLVGGCCSRRCLIDLIFIPAAFIPCIFVFLMTEDLFVKVLGTSADAQAVVLHLRCLSVTGEESRSCLDVVDGTGSGRSRR